MKFDSILLIAISACIVIGAILVFIWRRHVLQRRMVEQINKENRERQDFVLAKLDAIGRIGDNRDMSVADIQRGIDDIFAEMESQNLDGSLDPLIADVKAYYREELARRRAS